MNLSQTSMVSIGLKAHRIVLAGTNRNKSSTVCGDDPGSEIAENVVGVPGVGQEFVEVFACQTKVVDIVEVSN